MTRKAKTKKKDGSKVKVSKNSLKNLKPLKFYKGDPRAKKFGALGGHKTAELTKRRRAFKHYINTILDQPVKGSIAKKLKQDVDFEKDKLNFKEAMIFAQILKAIKVADTHAFNAIVDRVEGKPDSKLKVEAPPTPFVIKTPKEDIIMGIKEKEEEKDEKEE